MSECNTMLSLSNIIGAYLCIVLSYCNIHGINSHNWIQNRKTSKTSAEWHYGLVFCACDLISQNRSRSQDQCIPKRLINLSYCKLWKQSVEGYRNYSRLIKRSTCLDTCPWFWRRPLSIHTSSIQEMDLLWKAHIGVFYNTILLH